MEQQELSNELIQNLTYRKAESDSMLSLKTKEEQGWYRMLPESDNLLEDSELRRVQEKQKARERTKVWFCMGTLMGLLIGMIL